MIRFGLNILSTADDGPPMGLISLRQSPSGFAVCAWLALCVSRTWGIRIRPPHRLDPNLLRFGHTDRSNRPRL